jgi:hypothetical protein
MLSTSDVVAFVPTTKPEQARACNVQSLTQA